MLSQNDQLFFVPLFPEFPSTCKENHIKVWNKQGQFCTAWWARINNCLIAYQQVPTYWIFRHVQAVINIRKGLVGQPHMIFPSTLTENLPEIFQRAWNTFWHRTHALDKFHIIVSEGWNTLLEVHFLTFPPPQQTCHFLVYPSSPHLPCIEHPVLILIL